MVLPLIRVDKILKQYNQTVKDYLWTEKEAEDKLLENVHRWGKGRIGTPKYRFSIWNGQVVSRRWAELDSQLKWIKIGRSKTVPSNP